MKNIYTLLFALMTTSLGFAQVFITELADPNDNANARYIELYNAGGTTVDLTDWTISKYTNASASISQTITLTGSIPAGGFYIIATGPSDSVVFDTWSVTPNQWDPSTNHVAGSNGDDNIELYDDTNTLIDQFGVPGEDGTGTCHEFEDGRAERIATVTSGNTSWDESEWNIWADNGTTSCTNKVNTPQDTTDSFDPGEWIGEGPSCTAPTSEATVFSESSVTSNTATLSWTRGNGDNVIVVMKADSAVDFSPTSGNPYAANSVFSSGTELGTGNYVIYNGSSTSQAITGLTGDTTYHVAVYEYNTTDTCYMSTALTGTFTTIANTKIEFTGTTASVSEGFGTYELEFTIINEDAIATSFDVVLATGDNTDIDGYITESVTFPSGSAADQIIELTITDDALFETDETLTFEIQNVTGGSSATVGTNNSFDLIILNNDAPATLTLPYTEDFSDCGAAQWVAFNENASNTWTCATGAYTMNGFPNSDDVDWLISNFSIDFDLTSNENIAVITSEEFGDNINDFEEFELRYSTDYAGFGDPTGATWTSLTFDPNNTSTSFGASAESTTVVDASGISGVAYLAFFYDAGAGSGPEEWNIHNILIQEGALPTSVELVSSSASVEEDSGTYDLVFAITNEDATNATTFDIVLTAGNTADIDSYTTETVTFAAGTSTNQTLTITITDDAIEELDETLTFEIQNIAGGNSAAVGANNTFDLTILANDVPPIEGLLYDADFSNEGDGFVAHTTSSPPAAGPTSVGPFGTAPNSWSLSYDTAPGTDGSDNSFEVVSGELQSDDWGGQGIFTSQVIDVSGVNTVNISATGINSGANENDFNYFYIIDGGSRVNAANISSSNGDPVNYSIIGLDVSGATDLVVGFEFFENGSGDGYDISEFLVLEGATNTSVQLASTSASVFEDAGTVDLIFEILNEDATNPTTFDVVLTIGDAADVNSYTTQTITFPAGPGPDQGLTITITDDMIEESTEVLTFEIQNVAGGDAAVVGANNSFELTIQDNDGNVALPGDIVISEIMYNTPSTDDEWIEIYNASGAEITLDADWRLNYSGNTYDFSGTLIAADSYLTIALGSNGDGTYNNNNPFTPDISVIGTPAATTNNSNNLGNTSATIELIFEPSGANTTIDTVTYDDGAPWPAAADGNGPTLELIDVTFDNSLATSWLSSGDYDGGTPGTAYVAPITYTYNGTWSPNDPNGSATAGDDIVITSGHAIINTNTTANSVTVNPGAGLTVNSGVTLTTTNGLFLDSSSTSYSSLILDGTIAGTLTYDRHININGSGTTGSNDLISAPLTGEAFNTFADANSNIFNNGTLYLFGPFEKATGTYVTWANTETATLDPGVGYRAATNDNSSVTFTGIANNGTVSNNIINAGTNNAEWNLVGNPYPSYLNVQQFLSHDVGGVTNIQLFNAATAAIYGYDGSALNGWTVYNLANTTASTVIAPGQGFFVSADATNASLYDLEFTSTMRSTGTDDDFISGRNAELIYIKLNASSANKSYNTEFYFNTNATEGFDLGYDAAVWSNSTPDFALYSHLIENNQGNAITLQTLNTTNLNDVTIPLGVKANQEEQLTFSIADMNVPTSTKIYLEDIVENTTTLLNNVNYIITPSTDLSGTGRFYLRTSNDALSTTYNDINTLNIFALNSSKEIIVNGQLKDQTVLNLFDTQGRNVLSTKLDISNTEHRIDVSSLNGGIYVVTVKNNGQQKTQKVVIN